MVHVRMADEAILRPFQQYFSYIISGRWVDDNERLCAVEPHLRWKRSSPLLRLEITTARSVGQSYRGSSVFSSFSLNFMY